MAAHYSCLCVSAPPPHTPDPTVWSLGIMLAELFMKPQPKGKLRKPYRCLFRSPEKARETLMDAHPKLPADFLLCGGRPTGQELLAQLLCTRPEDRVDVRLVRCVNNVVCVVLCQIEPPQIVSSSTTISSSSSSSSFRSRVTFHSWRATYSCIRPQHA